MEIGYEQDDIITFCQAGGIDTIINRFQLDDAHDAASPMHVDLHNSECEDQTVDTKTYQRMIGSLMYAALGTRPDISYSVMLLSRFSQHPLQMHLSAAKRVLRSLKATKTIKLRFRERPLL
jgi:hypothetical protein